MKEAIPFDVNATGAIDLHDAASTKVAGGRYSLRRMLGRGGMGIVWLAFDERLKREVALKFLPPQIKADPVALDDLRRETARSQNLTHPNIVRIHDLYEANDEDPFISMEFVDGQNLGAFRVQQTERVLTWTYLEPLVMQLCSALEYAHGEGIIHRDLKPANVMVDQAGRLKLADFGIARAVTDTMSRDSIAKTTGTLLYMSPQQLDGGLPKITDDIYGVGATLYELLTSKPPFYTGDLPHQVRNLPPRSLRQRLRELHLTNDIPEHVEEVIAACLSKNEGDRPNRAREVADWLITRRRPPGLVPNGRPTPKVLAAIANAWKARPGWCYAGAGGVAAITLACVMWGHGHKKVAARVSDQNGQPAASRSNSLPAKAAPTNRPTSIAQQPAAPASPPKTVVRKPGEDFKTPPVPIRPSPPEPAVVAAPPVPANPAPAQPVVQVAQASDPTPRPTVAAPVLPAAPPPRLVAEAAAPPPQPAPVAATRSVAAVIKKTKAPTALQLAHLGNARVSERSSNQVVQITSSPAPLGSPPHEWRITYYDAKALYKAVEVIFENGQVARIHEPTRILKIFTPQAQKPFEFEKLKIDSDRALEIALAIPAKESVTVRSSELELQRGYGGAPVWQVKLFGPGSVDATTDKPLGYAIILTEDGRVLKETVSKNLARSQ